MTEDLMPIGRFARLTGLTVKALRHYDAQGLLHPSTVDPGSGYRLYGTDQLETGRLIRRLRDLDVPLDVVGDALAAHAAGDDAKGRAMLARHLANVEASLTRHQRIAHHLRMLLQGEEAFPMEPTHDDADRDDHRRIGVELFNETWTLMEKTDRTPEDDLAMLHTAHASAYHWSQAVHGPEHRARGEWQISRVHTVLGQPEPARYHAEACLRICEEHGIGDWDVAFAHEALARAAMVAGDRAAMDAHLERARELGAQIADPEDRALLEQDLATIVR
ncbi:MAG: MerR family transcriptional regulator [Actinomycetota bacterium]